MIIAQVSASVESADRSERIRASYRKLPSVDRLASDDRLRGRLEYVAAREAARIVLDDVRGGLGEPDEEPPDLDELIARTDALLDGWLRPGPARIINATGVILHTNLGRAPLSRAAQDALQRAAAYCSVEFDLRSGARYSRQEHLRSLLRAVSGAEDGMAVTNNAAAIFLVLRGLCHRREVLVSRGEAVAIGDGFRIPSIVAASGVRLVDVGTTNRTSARDYEDAITDRTAAILRVHPSNFTIHGFTERPTTVDCALVAQHHALLLIEDVGSGCIERLDESSDATQNEPLIRAVLQDGADVVTCSADKLCGGPQAGLIFANKARTAKLRAHPVARVVRPDKLIVGALAATLASYVRGHARAEIPVQRMLAMSIAEIERRANSWSDVLHDRGLPVSVLAGMSTVGGGAMPSAELPTMCLTLPDQRGVVVRGLAMHEPAIVARVVRGRIWLDPRTVDPQDDPAIVEGIFRAWEAQFATRI